MAISPDHPPRSIAFGIDRIGLFALARPRLTALAVALIAIVGIYGLFNLSIDRDLRSLFRGETEIYQTYVDALETFVDPENQLLVLVEGDAIAEPETLTRLRDLHLELSLLPDVGNVFSPFSLREAPDADGATRPLIADTNAGLTDELIDRIRQHPILGSTVLSADGAALVYVVTHAEQRAPLEQHDALIADVNETTAAILGDAPVEVTVAGFSAIRAEIVRLLKRDQIVLNVAGMAIGFIISLILFRSLIAAAVTATPAIFAGLSLLGWTGSLGVEITVLSGVVPALVMVLGFADGMHLTTAWRRYRLEGHSVVEAERLALIEAGPACMLSALTTAIAFLSMLISDVAIVRDFGRIGAIGTVSATVVVLVGHGLIVRILGRFWPAGEDATFAIISRLSAPVAAITGFVTRRSWLVVAAAIPITAALGAGYFAVPPEHSLSETLSRDDPMVVALGVIDDKLGGAFPVQIIVPIGTNGIDAEALDRIRSVHEAVDGLGASRPASLWSLVEWLGGDTTEALDLLADLPAETRRSFLSDSGALVTVNLAEQPTAEMDLAIDAIEAAARAAMPDVIVTGATVVGARESTRTIGQLNRSLGAAVVIALVLVAVAMRSAGAGLVAAVPNLLPIVAIGTILLVLGAGMQLTSVVSLTVAFGIAIDDTIHYLNVFFLTPGRSVKERLIEASRRVGPVLVATTLVLVGGMLMTLTSGLATVALYGLLAIGSLTFALIGDILLLPAIVAGPARRLFARRSDSSVEVEVKPAE